MKTRDSIFYNPIVGNFISAWIGFTIISLSSYINGPYGYVSGHGPVILGLFIGVVWMIRLHAYHEAYRIEVKHFDIDHSNRFMIRCIVALGVGMIVHIMAEGVTTMAFVRSSVCAMFIGSIFWLLFDFILNYDRGKAIFYVSSYYKSARTDRFVSEHLSAWIWLVSKGVLFLFCTWLYNYSFSW